MADYRTKPESELTFYVFSQPEGIFKLNRYDTLDESISYYKEIFDIAGKFAGIGVSRNGVSEIDIIHKRGDISVHVTDHLKLNNMKFDRDIQAAVKYVTEILSIKWELNNNIFRGPSLSSVCIPFPSSDSDALHNEYVDELALKPDVLDDVSSSIAQVYTEDDKWLSTTDIKKMCRDFLYPKIESFSVKTEDIVTKEERIISVSPYDFLQMADNYVLSHSKNFPEHEVNSALYKLAGELNDFNYDYDTYEYKDRLPAGGELEVVEKIVDDLRAGNTKAYIAQLNDIIGESAPTPDVLFKANELLNRLILIVPETAIEVSLEDKIKNAAKTNIKIPQSNTEKVDFDRNK